MAENYYFVGNDIKPKTASAWTKGPTPVSYDLIEGLAGLDSLPFEMVLKKTLARRTGIEATEDLKGIQHFWLDLQPNNLVWPFMSRALRDTIDANLTGQEGLGWLAALVSGRGEQREYYIPRFGKKLDVLDPDKSTFVPGTAHVIKPVFSLQKLTGLSVFYKQDLFWQIPNNFYVNEAIRQSILEKGLTGLDFSLARVA